MDGASGTVTANEDNSVDDGFSEPPCHASLSTGNVGVYASGDSANEFSNGILPNDRNISLPPTSSSTFSQNMSSNAKQTLTTPFRLLSTSQSRQYRVLNVSTAYARSELQSGMHSFIKESGLESFAHEGGMYEQSGNLADPKVGHLVNKSKDEASQYHVFTVRKPSVVGSSASSATTGANTSDSTSSKITANSTGHNRLKRFAEHFEEDPRTLKQLRFTGTWSAPSESSRNKGLRHFAMKVCQKVQSKGVTSYNEVADELVAEMFDTPNNKNVTLTSEQLYDQKNVRRRVYDALNVLMAINIIMKDKKEIKWIGLPTNSAQELQNLELERQDRMDRIKQKRTRLNELILQQIAFKNLVKRNKESEATNGGLPPEANTIIRLPFIIIKTSQDTDIDCSIASDRREYLFNFDKPFQVQDDVQILKKMGLCLGLENATCSEENLNYAQSLLPLSLHPHLNNTDMPEYRVYGELALISVCLCLGVTSLILSDWITIENPVKTGYVRFGLIQKCDRVHQRPEEYCTTLDDRPFEWWLAACLLVASIVCQMFTLFLTLIRTCRRCSRVISHSRINQFCIGFSVLSVFMLSSASIAFPAGFHMDAIGGAPFRLPENVSLTSTYFIFYAAVICSFIHFLALILWR